MSLVIGERHPQRVRAKYVDYYNGTRAHRPRRRPSRGTLQPPSPGTMVEVPRVGGFITNTAGGRSQE
jgi:hypothetical protein